MSRTHVRKYVPFDMRIIDNPKLQKKLIKLQSLYRTSLEKGIQDRFFRQPDFEPAQT